MTIGLPFINHIKALYQNLINDKDVALDSPWSYEIEIQPSSTQSGSQQSPVSSVNAIKTGATVAALRVSTKGSRIWSVGQESSWYVEHTRSNLG